MKNYLCSFILDDKLSWSDSCSINSCSGPPITALMHLWKNTSSGLQRRSAGEIRSTAGLAVNLRKSPQTVDELGDDAGLHIGAYH